MSHQPPVTSGTQLEESTSQHAFKNTISPRTFAVIVLIAFIICGFLADGIHNLSTSALLALPVFAQLFGSFMLGRRFNGNRVNTRYHWLNLLAASACILVYCLLWLIYSGPVFNRVSQALSLVSLGLICVFLLFVGLMTAAFIVGPPEGEPIKLLPRLCEDLRTGIQNEPLWAIALFFILFLGVAYLFGFALAFHDRSAILTNKNKPALHMINLKSIDDGQNEAAPSDTTNTSNTDSSVNGNESTPPTGPSTDRHDSLDIGHNEFCFYFAEKQANVIHDEGNCVLGNPDRLGTLAPKDFNTCSLQNLVSNIEQLFQRGQRLRVNLLGHSDNEPVKIDDRSRYISNYELSQSRAENVEYEVLQKLRQKGLATESIHWNIFAAADEPLTQINRRAITEQMFVPTELATMGVQPNSDRKAFLDQIQRYLPTEAIDHKLPATEKRVVIATVESMPDSPVILGDEQMKDLKAGRDEVANKLTSLQTAQNQYISQSKPRPLRLIDYMYFSIYTITTTGYGDIIPTTSYAKFVTSLANICEVLFLVVFFNALISIKKDKTPNDSVRVVRAEPISRQAGKSKDKVVGRITPP